MNAIGKDVDNRSGFFWGENPVFFLTLVLYQADSPFGGAVFFVFLQAQCPEIWHSFRFGSRFGLQTLSVQTLAHTPWPVSSCLSVWVTCCGLQMMLMPVPGSLEGT